MNKAKKIAVGLLCLVGLCLIGSGPLALWSVYNEHSGQTPSSHSHPVFGATVAHPAATGDEVHTPYRWKPADATARAAINVAASHADDVGCLAWQQDDNSSWVAIASGTGANKWFQVGASSGGALTVRAATTANITLSGAQTIDAVSVVAADRVLVKNQSTGSQNGIYVAASGSWTRSTDFDTSAEAIPMALVGVSEGTVNGNHLFALTTNATITLGSTSLTFADITGSLPLDLATQVTGVLAKANQDRGFVVQVGTDANVNANANGYLRMPSTTAQRTASLPASPADGDWVRIQITNGVTFNVVVSGNGHNINDGFNAPASTFTMTNDGQSNEFVYVNTDSEWKVN